ncbi:unnamed protein product [Notodromas monacha]|uniref:Coronin n=1 Tax=Notodromas monacha TaxID=399045 RepID=A0A7R9BJL7_9CRUS|nr:unnamed protein product [Notodromas monacha]CAG0916716.1 unnamed protein product [Notodromas monacha]
MAWRFKASKYKNAFLAPAKKNDWIHDIDVGEIRTALNPSIAASSAYVVFSQEGKGSGCVGIVDAGAFVDCDPPPSDRPTLPGAVEIFNPHLHQQVTCLDFSPFDDGLLATGSEDSMVKLWHLKDDRVTPECLFIPVPETKVEAVKFNSACDFLLTASAGDSIQIIDLVHQKQIQDINGEFCGPVNSMDWNVTGSELALIDQQCRIIVTDPRRKAKGSTHIIDTSLVPNKEAHIVWLADAKLLVTGFDKSRQRVASVHDLKNPSSAVGSTDFGTGIGSLVPLYDSDTEMLFLSARGETGISFAEIASNVPTVRLKAMSDFGTKAACLAPKRSLSVMTGEVNRLYQLSSKALIPLNFIVPRKSYRDFHADLFPPTRAVDSALVPDLWLQGKNIPTLKISLDPAQVKPEEIKYIKLPLNQRKAEAEDKTNIFLKSESEELLKDKIKTSPAGKKNSSNESEVPVQVRTHALTRNDEVRRSAREIRDQFETRTGVQPESNPSTVPGKLPSSVFGTRPVSMEEPRLKDSVRNGAETKPIFSKSVSVREAGHSEESVQDALDKPGEFQRQVSNRKSKTFGRVAKFRHMKGTVPPRAQLYDNLRDLNPSLPTECDGIRGNEERFAVTLRGPSGKILVWSAANTGRLPDTIALLSLINSNSIVDFAWDPFDARRLACATDDCTINIWDVVAAEKEDKRDQPMDRLRRPHGVPEKITLIKWHPTAKNILGVAHANGSIDLWEVATPAKLVLQFQVASSGIWSMEWSPDGRHLAVSSRDGKIRIVDGRNGDILAEGEGFSKGRGARVLWVLGGAFLLLSGFESGSSRVVKIFDVNNLQNGPLKQLEMDVSPSLVIPLYDEDSSTIFLYAKGDTTIHTYEVINEDPYLYPLSPHRSSTPHHGLTLLPKRVVDVKKVEFARALRLTDTTIEPIFFCVPRVKSEYFQDDLFPPTRQLWLPAVNASDWVDGKDGEQPVVMNANAAGDHVRNQPARSVSKESELNPTDKEKQKNVEKSLISTVAVNMRLEQDEMEGVDPKEWE